MCRGSTTQNPQSCQEPCVNPHPQPAAPAQIPTCVNTNLPASVAVCVHEQSGGGTWPGPRPLAMSHGRPRHRKTETAQRPGPTGGTKATAAPPYSSSHPLLPPLPSPPNLAHCFGSQSVSQSISQSVKPRTKPQTPLSVLAHTMSTRWSCLGAPVEQHNRSPQCHTFAIHLLSCPFSC